MRTSLFHIALLLTALLVAPISSTAVAAEAGPAAAGAYGAAADGAALLSQDDGSADLSMLVVVSLGILGLIWVRRHTAQL